jgi:N-methylhydantoinase A
MTKIIGVDVGGTFTDVVEFDGEQILGRKVPTSVDQSECVANAIAGSGGELFLHGTTAATNALLEGRGAKVALVTNGGYEDLIEIGRQDRPSLYDSSTDRPPPLVTRENRHGFDGSHIPVVGSVDVIAVGLIESYTDASIEQHLARELGEESGLPVVLSSQLSPEFREYERFSTTILSAYLTPSVADYLRTLDGRLEIETRLVMTSAGGLVPFENAPESAGRLVLSGPAGGAVAAAAMGAHHGYDSILSFDMGGTSTDVSRIAGGELTVGSGHRVAGRVNRVPSIPIRTIGAGGGSIGWMDEGGALRVGPRSAGSVPGPAGYGRGGIEPTVTDANIVAGRIPHDLALGGTVALDIEAAITAVARLGAEAGLATAAAAHGMLEVVDSHMEHALRSVSVEEGADPRDAVLVAFGGAGGLHAVRLARRLGMGRVLIPPHSGVFSALGLLLAAPRSDSAKTVMLVDGDDRLNAGVQSIMEEVRQKYFETFGSSPISVQGSADVRYVGQSHELEISAPPHWPEMRESFEVSHLQMFGFTRQDEDIEIVNIRAVAMGKAPVGWSDLPKISPDSSPRHEERVWARDTLPAGHQVRGPAIVVEPNSAVLLEEGSELLVLDDGTLEIST